MNKKPDQLYIDFASNRHNYRRVFGGGRGQPVVRALGLKTYGLPLNVLDCTAGLGTDAFVLASVGCNVIMLERVPAIALQLRAALDRAAEVTDLQEIIARMQLIEIDSIAYLNGLITADPNSLPDVIYLDPMFPQRTKSALVKKEMRILKEVVGDDPDADQLLLAAIKVAKRRVVVKRPRIAGFLGGLQPQTSQMGRANRFDLYVPTQ